MEKEQWKKSWGENRLIATVSDGGELPGHASEFIRSYGLPRRVIFELEPQPFEISFEPLSQPIMPVTDSVTWGGLHDVDREQAWSDYLVVAEERFSNGSALYCVCRPTADVRRVDAELDDPETFVNSSIEQFGGALLLVVEWSLANETRALTQWETSLTELASAITVLDAQAFALSSRSFWPALIEYAKMKPGSLTVTTDPKRSRLRL